MRRIADRMWGQVPDNAYVLWHNRPVMNGVFGFERFRFELSHSAVQTKHRRLSADDVNVANSLFDRCLQQFVNQDRCHRNRSKWGRSLWLRSTVIMVGECKNAKKKRD